MVLVDQTLIRRWHGCVPVVGCGEYPGFAMIPGRAKPSLAGFRFGRAWWLRWVLSAYV